MHIFYAQIPEQYIDNELSITINYRPDRRLKAEAIAKYLEDYDNSIDAASDGVISDVREFLEELSERIATWHSNCDCYECSDMNKAIREIDAIVDTL